MTFMSLWHSLSWLLSVILGFSRWKELQDAFWEGRFSGTKIVDWIDGLKGREQVSAAGELPPLTAFQESLEAEIAQAEKAGDEESWSAILANLAQAQKQKAERAKRAKRIARDGWLSPLELNERGPLARKPVARAFQRATNATADVREPPDVLSANTDVRFSTWNTKISRRLVIFTTVSNTNK